MTGPEFAIVESLQRDADAAQSQVYRYEERITYMEEQLDRLREQYKKVTDDPSEPDLEDLVDFFIDESERLQAEYTPEVN